MLPYFWENINFTTFIFSKFGCGQVGEKIQAKTV
jgi:hypothetical protein